MFMPLSRLAQYQHCLLRRSGTRTAWANSLMPESRLGLKEQMETLRAQWMGKVDSAPEA
jgi:hypothetical protein